MAIDSSGSNPIHRMSRAQSLRRTTTPEEQDKKLQEVAKKYEKHFLGEMVKAMRGTVNESGLVKTNQAETIFREQLDDQYVDKWGEKGGIGLGDMIYKQLLEKLGPSLGITRAPDRPRGPIALDQKSNFRMQPLKAPGESYAELPGSAARTPLKPEQIQKRLHLQFLRELQEPTLQLTAVQAPWEGKISGVKRLGTNENGDEFLLEMLHKNGLKSQMSFRGIVEQGIDGKNIQAGQRIGLLSPDAKALHWNLEQGPDPQAELRPKSVSE